MPEKSILFNREPVWLEHHAPLARTLPESAQSWIYEAGSLTQRLRDQYGSSVAVKVLFHRWKKPFLSEQRLLKTPYRRACLIREVLLHVDDTPLILARTILPEKTIRVAHRNLSHLGNRPLGEVIFSYPKLERWAMQLTQIQPSLWQDNVAKENHINQPVWGRRTIYAIHHQPMLVSEFFLPEILV